MLQRLCDCLRDAGTILLDAENIEDATHQKEGIGNFVTDYDILVQQRLYQSLRQLRPGARMIGEEDAVHDARDLAGDCFIVDPIDGTANFIRGYRHSGISVAFLQDGKAQLGAVYNPYMKELFYAERGHGAYCNGRQIQASRKELAQSIILFGAASYDRENIDTTLHILRGLLLRAEDVRNSGSAALDLCYVAAGRCEAFFELRLSPWDYAAGGLILEESGGIVSDLYGGALSYLSGGSVLAAASHSVHEACLQAVAAGLQHHIYEND